MNEDLNPLTNRKFVINLVKSKDNKLSFVPQKGKSEVWNTFERIYYDNNETLYVKCKYCDDIQKNITNGGTTGLLRHIEKCGTDGSDGRKQTVIRDKNEKKMSQNFNQMFSLKRLGSDLVIDRSFLIDLLKSSDNRLSFSPESGKSEVWNHFERIFCDNIETDYVKCKYCDDIQKHTTGYGTGGLLKHFNKCQVYGSDGQKETNSDVNNDRKKRQEINESIDLERSETDLVIDRNFLIDLVKCSDNRLSFSPESRKSDVWNHFERIHFDDCETNYVKCKNCDDIQKHSTGYGTGGLLKHINKCQTDSNDSQKKTGFIDNNDREITEESNDLFPLETIDSDLVIDRHYLLDLVKTSDDRLTFGAESRKSEVWNNFERVFYVNHETDYVKCKYCNDIQKHTTGYGTGGLLKHIIKCQTDKSDGQEKNDNERELNEEFNESINLERSESDFVIDRNYLINSIKNLDKRLSLGPESGKSEVWIKFERIFYDDLETPYVKCKYCDDIQKHIKGYGTGGLLKHINKCHVYSSDGQKMTSFDDNNDRKMSHEFNESINLDRSESHLVIDRNYLMDLVKTSDNRLSFGPESGKSEVWNKFERIFYDSSETPYVKCKYCDDIQKHTTNYGTGGLLRHRCKPNDEKKYSLRSNLKMRLIDEKSLIKKLSKENKTLKVIVEKCLKSIEKCLCINKYNSKEREDINHLIDDYNKWLFENKDYDIFEENYNKLNEDSDNDNFESYGKNWIIEEQEIESNSNNDSEYKPFIERKKLKQNSKPNVKKIQLKRTNFHLKVTNAIKKKYKKNVKKSVDKYFCEWPGCKKVFKWRANLREHNNKIHLKLKTHKCDWPGCDEAFINRSKLRDHVIRFHTNDRPFKCDQCSFASIYKGWTYF